MTSISAVYSINLSFGQTGKMLALAGQSLTVSFQALMERNAITQPMGHFAPCRRTQQRQQPSRAGPQVPVWKKQQSLADAPYQHELFDDGWPGFDEPYFTYD